MICNLCVSNIVYCKGLCQYCYNKQWREAQLGECLDCGTKVAKVWYKAKTQCNSCYTFYRKYGITKKQFYRDTSTCGVCQTTEKLVLDHDHKTGVIRGKLCFNHNVYLGQCGDDYESVTQTTEAFLDYLRNPIVLPVCRQIRSDSKCICGREELYLKSLCKACYQKCWKFKLQPSQLLGLPKFCMICKNKANQIDHDHITNEVRGVLCIKCNLLLGRLGDTILALQDIQGRFQSYLTRPKCDLERQRLLNLT